jgi:hypothetical protein
MDTEELVLFNLFEAGLWFVVAIVLALAWKKAGAPRWPLLAAAFVFVAFGISDLVETQTGAWWKPWWLLVWKAACVHAMLSLFIIHRRQVRGYSKQLPPAQPMRPPENLN